MSLEIFQVRALSDNYVYILRCSHSQSTAVIDPSETNPIVNFLNEKKWDLDQILLTHHHWDHVGGVRDLKEQFNARVTAPDYDRHRIDHVDRWVRQDDEVRLGNFAARVIYIPGHTLGHIAYYFPEQNALFCGDTLFSLGCGRLFEGSPEQMMNSLDTLKKMPPETRVFCAHEYTLNNAEFAIQVEPENNHLQQKLKEVKEKRKRNEGTIPSLLADELKCNPFLRSGSREIRENLRMEEDTDLEVFTRLRQMKDEF